MSIVMFDTRDDFEVWLTKLDDKIDGLLEFENFGECVDDWLSIASLRKVEAWMLARYESWDDIFAKDEFYVLDAVACYVGESFTKNIGGIWSTELDDPKMVFFGVPLIVDFGAGPGEFCPLFMLRVCLHRRTGTQLETIFENNYKYKGLLNSHTSLRLIVEEGLTPLVRHEDQPVFHDKTTGFECRSVSPPAQTLSGEVIECRLEPGANIADDVHPRPGLEHHLVMMEGGLTVTLESGTFELNPGDCLRYKIYGASAFKASDSEGAHYFTFIV